MRTDQHAKPKPATLLALGQIRYQLLLLVRNPLGFFVAIVMPLLLHLPGPTSSGGWAAHW